jgi:hypothetical protein
MGFVVEPYSYFLCYEIANLDKASSLLPDGFKLVKTKIFDTDSPKYYGILGCFNAHTSGFWGMRVEFYVIAEDIKTGLMSWIIIDYDTNTITYDPKHGFSDPNASQSLITIDYDGLLHVDVKNNNNRQLVFTSDTTKGLMTALDQRLWVEGNLSIAYGKNKIEDDPGIFSLSFSPKEFEKALRLPHSALNLELNSWYSDILESTPSELVCFPYAQHFLSDSPGHASQLTNEEELLTKVENVDFSQVKAFSTQNFKKMIVAGGIVSLATNTLLLSLLLMR